MLWTSIIEFHLFFSLYLLYEECPEYQLKKNYPFLGVIPPLIKIGRAIGVHPSIILDNALVMGTHPKNSQSRFNLVWVAIQTKVQKLI